VVNPASAAAPSWVGNGKFANYSGGFKMQMGTQGQAGYIKFQLTFISNFSISNTGPTTTMISGGWNVTVYAFVNGSTMINGEWGTNGTEIVNTVSSDVSTSGGFGFFGFEQSGRHTVLWVDNTTGLTATNVTIGGRHSVSITSPMNLTFANVVVPITRFYDIQTGLLLGFNIALNFTGMGGSPAPVARAAADIRELLNTNGAVKVDQNSGLGSLGEIVIPVVISSTNVVPYAWNPGGDLTLWLYSTGAIIGLSVIFGVLIYIKKK
jgi:hypothetical protein